MTVVAQIEDRIANNTAFKVNVVLVSMNVSYVQYQGC